MKILTKALIDSIYKDSSTSKPSLLGVFGTVNLVGSDAKIFLPGILFVTVSFEPADNIFQKQTRIFLKNENGDEIAEFYNRKIEKEASELNFIIELSKNKNGELFEVPIKPGKYSFFFQIEGKKEEWITEFIAQ